MSKYIIEIEDEPFVRLSALFGEEGLYRAKGFNSLVFDQFGLDKLTPLDKELDEAYQKGVHDGSLDVKERVEGAYQKGYNEAKLIYQNPNAESDYQRGLDDGKARNEDGCIGCRYDDGTTEHSPCNYCCNAYSNQWVAKEKTDKIVVGDEVRSNNAISDHSGIVLALSLEGNSAKVLENDGSMMWVAANVLTKTGRHFNFLTPLLEAMKGEQRNCSTCKHLRVNSIECTECFSYKGYNRWEPKEGAE